MPYWVSFYATVDSEDEVLKVFNEYEEACKDTDERTASIVHIETDTFTTDVIATRG